MNHETGVSTCQLLVQFFSYPLFFGLNEYDKPY